MSILCPISPAQGSYRLSRRMILRSISNIRHLYELSQGHVHRNCHSLCQLQKHSSDTTTDWCI